MTADPVMEGATTLHIGVDRTSLLWTPTNDTVRKRGTLRTATSPIILSRVLTLRKETVAGLSPIKTASRGAGHRRTPCQMPRPGFVQTVTGYLTITEVVVRR